MTGHNAIQDDEIAWKFGTATPRDPCQALPNELHVLAEFNIGAMAISLVYSLSNIVNKYGNAFEYVSVRNPDAHTRPWKMRQSGHVCCDEHQKSTTDKGQIFNVFLVGTDK